MSWLVQSHGHVGVANLDCVGPPGYGWDWTISVSTLPSSLQSKVPYYVCFQWKVKMKYLKKKTLNVSMKQHIWPSVYSFQYKVESWNLVLLKWIGHIHIFWPALKTTGGPKMEPHRASCPFATLKSLVPFVTLHRVICRTCGISTNTFVEVKEAHKGSNRWTLLFYTSSLTGITWDL